MYDFCPHCSQAIESEQIPGRMLVCDQCGQDIGFVGAVQRASVSETDQRILTGLAARCPVCQQIVEVKTNKVVPHYSPTRKVCAGSGKLIEPIETGGPPEKIRALMTRDLIKVVSCTRNREPRIEVLTLEYLDKSERVRIQIEALREMLGPGFRMTDYPAALHKPHLAMWGHSEACVIAARHERGGYQSIADTEVTDVLADLRRHSSLFFP